MSESPSALPLRIAVAFRSLAISEAVMYLLNRDAQADVSVAGSDYDSIVTHLEERRPDVLLAELFLRDGCIVRLAEELRSQRAATRLAVWASEFPDGVLQQLLDQQVRGLLLDSERPGKLLELLQQVSRGQFVLTANLREQLHEEPNFPGKLAVKRRTAVLQLSARQYDILERLARGGTVKEVARDLALTEKSVESHKYRLMKLLDLRDRLQLTRFAIREGIVSA